METITYHLQSDSKNYYAEISKFTSYVLKESKGFVGYLTKEFKEFVAQNLKKEKKIEECVLEALILGVLWNSYSSRSLNLDKKTHKLLSKLSILRNEIPELKREIDDVRGILATMFLLDHPNTRTQEDELVELNLENLDLLLKWLEAVGDYQQELKHLKIWREFLSKKQDHEIALALTEILMLADWFGDSACKHLSQFTPHVNDFIDEKLAEHLNKEDVIFCGRKQIEYHLNMVGAEIMNRVYRNSFENRPRKAVLLPGCMRSHHSTQCKSKKENLGLKCVMCDKNCYVSQISSRGIKEGFEVYIISHESTAFSQSTPHDQEELGIVGVSCVNNLIAGGWKSDSMGIPAQCVILEYVGCQNHWHHEGFPTQINQTELEKILAL